MFRLGRFVSLVEMNKFYQIAFTGSVPDKLRFRLESQGDGIKIHLKYDQKNLYAVMKNGKEVKETEFDNKKKISPELSRKDCG